MSRLTSWASLLPLDPDVPVFDHVDLGLQGEGPFVGDLEGGFEQLAVAGAAGLGAGDDHLDRVPVAGLVTLERLVRADPGIVADLELMREGLVPQVEAAVRIPGGAEFQAEGEVAVVRLHRVDLGHLGGRVLRAGDHEDAVLDREPAVVGGRLAGQVRLAQPPAGQILPVEDGLETRLVGTSGGEEERRDEEREGARPSRPLSIEPTHQDAPGKDRTPPDPSL